MTKGSMGTRAVRARVPTGAGTLVVDVGVATIPAGASALAATDVPLPTLLPSTGSARSRFRHLGRAAWATLVAGMATSTGLATLPAAALPTLAHAATVSPGTAAIFVANEGAAGSTGSVTEYKVRDSGNVRPVLTISRGVNQPYGLAFDASGDLWVANNNSNTVVEYKKSELAKASPAPSVIISSSPDQALNGPSGLAFDSFGNLWVDNGGTNTVIEYTKAELSGSGSPAPRVNFTNAALFAAAGPAGLAVDPSGDLWVEGSPSGSGDAVCEYPKAQLAKPGPPAPRATISRATSSGILPSTPRATSGCPSTMAARWPSTPKPSSPSRDHHRCISLLLGLFLLYLRRPTSLLTLRATCGCSAPATTLWSSTPRPNSPSRAHRRPQAS